MNEAPAVTVRHAALADADALARLRHALWPDGSQAEHRREVERFFAGPQTAPVLVAEDRSGLVGFAELSIRAYAEGCDSGRVGFLEGWYVIPETRRRGVGGHLLRAAEAWARSAGCVELGSDAEAANELGAAAHRALGFEEVGLIRCFRKDLRVTSEVSTQSVPSRRVAVIRQWLKWTELGSRLIPLLDRVYVAVRAGQVIQSGQNIFIYRNASQEGATVEVGVEVAERFEPVGEIVYSETPAGVVAAAAHTGPYSSLGQTHDAVMRWCKEQGHALTGTSWEVYGDWREDPAQLETEVYYLLRAASGV